MINQRITNENIYVICIGYYDSNSCRRLICFVLV